MKILVYILSIIIILLIILIISLIKKVNYISKTVDEVVQGNFNQRIRLQNHIKPVNTLCIKVNSLIIKMQKIFEKNKVNEDSIKKVISNISHDLRTPLTSMIGYIELILNDSSLSEDEKKQYINIVYNKGNHLYNLMEEFFQVSKLESKDIRFEIKEINISEVIRQNIVSFFNDFKKLDIEPEINIPEKDVYALTDEKALNRILSNLINNTLKYGSQGNIMGINLREDKNYVFIDVWDNGAGIPEKEIDYVFDRLYTVEKSRKLNLKSSGLGLTIVKKLVESLGGTISITSIPFEKTTFTFTLPKIFKKNEVKQ